MCILTIISFAYSFMISKHVIVFALHGLLSADASMICSLFISIDLFPQGGIKLKRRIKIKDERIKLACRSHTFKTLLKVRRGNTLSGIYEMVYPIILPSIRYSFLVY